MVKKKRVPIIFEDDAIIVCEKPAGMPVQSDHTRDLDVLTTLKHHIFEEQAGEEEPYLTVVHRLDRPVGGLMVLAKTKEAAASLSKQIQEFEFEKNYQAVVCGNLKEDFGTFEDYPFRFSFCILSFLTRYVKTSHISAYSKPFFFPSA